MTPRSPARPRRRPIRAAALTAAAFLAASCGGGAPTVRDATAPQASTPATTSAPVTTTSAPASEPSPTAASPSTPAAEGTAIRTGDSEFGTMLFDESGQAIYLFDKETSRPACYGDCAAAWPPVLTTGIPRAGGAVRPELLGTVPRDDGSMQVTYGGHPLYYYAHEDPGQVLCHDVVDFGGRWLVVTPEGTPAP